MNSIHPRVGIIGLSKKKGKQMSQQINISVLKPHPKNNEFFDDLNGEEFERLKNSIKDEKIYTDILVSPDMTIISGHQRIRAAKELGMTLVPIKIDEDLQDEKSKLRALISNNFGRRKNNPAKDRKALATYVELKGYGYGGNRSSRDQSGLLNLDEIAKELNISKTNLKRALRIERNLTDSMKELLDSGEITKTFASDTIASLSEEEQEELISKLDVTKKYTQKQIQQYLDKNKSSSKDDDNELKQQIKKLEKEKSDIELLNQTLKSSKEATENLMEAYKKESEEYTKIKDEIARLNLQPNGDYNVLDIAKDISILANEIENLLATRLSPIRYSKIFPVIQSNDALKRNLENIIYVVNDWCKSMSNAIGIDLNKNIIDMEEII